MSKLTDFPTYSAKTKKRVKYGILGSGLIVVLVMASLLTQQPTLDPLPGKISVILKAQVYRGGVLVEERVNDDDLILNNFIESLAGLLYWPNNQAFDVALVDWDEDNNDHTFWNDTADETIADTTLDNVVSVGYYGEGTTNPARTNFQMEGEAQFAQENLTDVNQDDDSFTLTFIATSDGSYDWTESGLSIYWYSSEASAMKTVFMVHDVFSAMAVVADDSLVLNYQFTFATGFTWNMINLLRSVFQGADMGELNNLYLYDTLGNLRETRLYTDEADDEWRGHVSSNFYGGHMVVSDSASGVPSRTARVLLGSTLQTPATVENDTDGPTYYVSTQAIFMPTEAFTIRASCLYTYFKGLGGYNYYSMLFALSHSAVYVAAGTPVRSTFTIEV